MGEIISTLSVLGKVIFVAAFVFIIFYLLRTNKQELEEIKQRKRFLEEVEEQLRLRIERTRGEQICLLKEKERLFNAQAKNDVHMQLLNMTSDKLTKPSDSGAISLIKEDKGDNNDSVTFDELERRLTQYVPGEYTAEDE